MIPIERPPMTKTLTGTGSPPRFCVCIAGTSYDTALKIVRRHPLAEIRLESMRLSPGQVRRLFKNSATLIATCRPGTLSVRERKASLIRAIDAGAAMVDVELESAPAFRREVIRAARRTGCRVIVSHHDFEKTPGRAALARIVDRCFKAGADVAKVACTVCRVQDCARLVGLLDDDREIVVAGMGPLGPRARIAAMLAGVPFVYAALKKGRETAAGQMDVATLSRVARALDRVTQ